MALVDYSSSASESQESLQLPPAKRRRESKPTSATNSTTPTTRTTTTNNANPPGTPSHPVMPPLPASFHDLYASTVRHSTIDDPTFHQGRKRLTPHVPGNWPSHIYIEWHPSGQEHDKLVKLLADIESELSFRADLQSFLTSDLGAPLPLHISLSRPLSLTTSNKDEFLNRIKTAIETSAVKPFVVSPRHLAWFKSPDSNRVFLILRVESSKDMNPELMTLLEKCNQVSGQFSQPLLYQKRSDESVSFAFHVSIAWMFEALDETMASKTLVVFKGVRFNEIRGWKIDVGAVKVKIGNAVHHVELTGVGKDVSEVIF